MDETKQHPTITSNTSTSTNNLVGHIFRNRLYVISIFPTHMHNRLEVGRSLRTDHVGALS